MPFVSRLNSAVLEQSQKLAIPFIFSGYCVLPPTAPLFFPPSFDFFFFFSEIPHGTSMNSKYAVSGRHEFWKLVHYPLTKEVLESDQKR